MSGLFEAFMRKALLRLSEPDEALINLALIYRYISFSSILVELCLYNIFLICTVLFTCMFSKVTFLSSISMRIIFVLRVKILFILNN